MPRHDEYHLDRDEAPHAGGGDQQLVQAEQPIAPCPHCGEPSGPGTRGHVCADRLPWSSKEKDVWRAQVRRWSPAIMFAPSSDFIANHFGARNRADRMAERS